MGTVINVYYPGSEKSKATTKPKKLIDFKKIKRTFVKLIFILLAGSIGWAIYSDKRTSPPYTPLQSGESKGESRIEFNETGIEYLTQ